MKIRRAIKLAFWITSLPLVTETSRKKKKEKVAELTDGYRSRQLKEVVLTRDEVEVVAKEDVGERKGGGGN